MPREKHPPQTMALRNGRYALDMEIPASLPAGDTAQINGATASTLRNNLQAAINGNGDQYIVINGDCRGGLVQVLGENNAAANRYILAGTDCWMPGLVMYGASRWRLGVDESKATWMRWGETIYRPFGKTGGALTLIDTDDVIIDRWRHSSPGSNWCNYYNTDGNVVRDTHWQRGRYDNNGTSLREHVVIARPASCYDLLGGTGTFSSPGNLWGLESHDCSVRECYFLDSGDAFQNISQRQYEPGKLWRQQNALYLDDQNLRFYGCDFQSRRRYDGAEDYALVTEQAGQDYKNCSRNAERPIRSIDCRHYGARIGRARAPGVGGKSLDDPGVATAMHYKDSDHAYWEQSIYFDNNRDFASADGGGNNCGWIDVLAHHGVTRLNGAVVDRIDFSGDYNDTLSFSLYKTNEHPDSGTTQITRSAILHNPRALSLQDFDTLAINNSMFIGNGTLGAYGGNIIGSGNVADQSGLPGSTVVDRAAILARMGSLLVQTPDPDNVDDPTAFVTWTLEQALFDLTDAPDDYIWVIGNEDTVGAPGGGGGGTGSGTSYLEVTEVTGTAGNGLSALGSTTDGTTDDSENHRWSAAKIGNADPYIEWFFGGAYTVEYIDIWWSFGAARQSKFTLNVVDADGVVQLIGYQMLSEQRSGWQRVDIDRSNIASAWLIGHGTEIDGVYNNEWTSINEVRFGTPGADSGDNTMITLDDRQVVINSSSGPQSYTLPATDDDGDPITYSLQPHSVYGGWDNAIGSRSIVGNVLTLSPGNISGLAGFRLQANDGKGLPNSIAFGEWEVIVEVGNQAPKWSTVDDQAAPGDVVFIDLDNLTTDADGDSLVYSSVSSTPNISAELKSDGHTLRVEFLAEGSGSVWMSASDANHAPVQGRIDYTIRGSGATTISECVVEGLARG